MVRSIQEEVITALWVIAALLAFGFGFPVWGWIFTVKAVVDFILTLRYAYKELQEEIK